jgi:hypothetical protein
VPIARDAQGAPPPAEVPHAPHRPLPWAAFTATAVGVAGIAVGTVYGVEVFSDKADRNLHCQGGCDSVGFADDSAARAAAVVSTVGFGVGAAGLLAGAWLLWKGPGSKPPAVVPITTANARGFGLSGTW